MPTPAPISISRLFRSIRRMARFRSFRLAFRSSRTILTCAFVSADRMALRVAGMSTLTSSSPVSTGAGLYAMILCSSLSSALMALQECLGHSQNRGVEDRPRRCRCGMALIGGAISEGAPNGAPPGPRSTSGAPPPTWACRPPDPPMSASEALLSATASQTYAPIAATSCPASC